MEYGFFTTFFSQPLYNGLIFLIDVLPGANAGLAVILFTIVVRLVLFPLSKKSIETQLKLKSIEKDIERVRTNVKDKTQQAAEIMGIYRAKGINPLSGFVLILIQIPIIFALYHIFLQSGLPTVDTSLLYSFVTVPAEALNMDFLGIFELTEKSYILAALCALSQFVQAKMSFPIPPKTSKTADSFKDNLARSMSVQMRYIVPIMVFFIVYNLSGIIALYWITNNIFAIVQESLVRRRFKSVEQPQTV